MKPCTSPQVFSSTTTGRPSTPIETQGQVVKSKGARAFHLELCGAGVSHLDWSLDPSPPLRYFMAAGASTAPARPKHRLEPNSVFNRAKSSLSPLGRNAQRSFDHPPPLKRVGGPTKGLFRRGQTGSEPYCPSPKRWQGSALPSAINAFRVIVPARRIMPGILSGQGTTRSVA